MTKKEITILISLTILIFVAYLAGRFHRSSESKIDLSQAKQKAIDSTQTCRYKIILDSLSVENKVLQKAYNSISEFKRKQKLQINETETKIINLPDLSVQRYVDSLRNVAGFH